MLSWIELYIILSMIALDSKKSMREVMTNKDIKDMIEKETLK
jgi:hypothetical protein